jgi:hypothetical protein
MRHARAESGTKRASPAMTTFDVDGVVHEIVNVEGSYAYSSV